MGACPQRRADRPRPHTAACWQHLATPRRTVVASLSVRRARRLFNVGPTGPTGAVVAFAFLFAAFAYTQFDMVDVTDQEGSRAPRRERQRQLCERGYFRKWEGPKPNAAGADGVRVGRS